MPRKLHGLELLRGLCAVLVCAFHSLYWGGITRMPSWGLYGVYVFFGISGAVLHYNYKHIELADVPVFLLKRFARLFPLVLLCMIVLAGIRQQWEWDLFFLNASMLFGFGSPGSSSYLPGGWSIGIEVVFYALFPTLLAFTRNPKLMLGALVGWMVLRTAFVTHALHGTDDLGAWTVYIQPASFVVFFFGGMAVAELRQHARSTTLWAWSGFAAALALFVLPGASDDDVLLGFRGVVDMALTVLVVGGFFWSTTVGATICEFFGDISYGLYLLHPLVWQTLLKLHCSLPMRIALTMPLAIVSAWIVLRIYERPARKWILRVSLSRPTTPSMDTKVPSAL